LGKERPQEVKKQMYAIASGSKEGVKKKEESCKKKKKGCERRDKRTSHSLGAILNREQISPSRMRPKEKKGWSRKRDKRKKKAPEVQKAIKLDVNLVTNGTKRSEGTGKRKKVARKGNLEHKQAPKK